MHKTTLKLLLIGLVVFGINSAANALTPEESSSEKYLDNHGYSKETIRMVNVQKSRTSDQVKEDKNNKFVRFFKRLVKDPDVTIPATEFGDRKIEYVD